MVALLQTVPTLVTLAALWLATVLVLRRLLPALTSLLSRHVSIRTVSLRSIRGLEWRHTRRREGRDQSVSVRVERVGYKFHRSHKSRGVTSWLTLVVEDVRVVVRDSASPPEQTQDGSSPSDPISPASPSSSISSPTATDGDGLFEAVSPPMSPISPSSPSSPAKPRSALLSPLSPSALNEAAGSYFSPDLTPTQLGGRLWSQYKYQARRLAERWLRSALNTLPALVQVIDVEITGSTVCRVVKEGTDDGFGSRPLFGLEAALTGGLRLHANIELSALPASRRRSLFAPPKGGYGLPAKRFRSSAMAILQRGLGRAAGDASLTLECGPGSAFAVRALPGDEVARGLKSVTSGLAWFSSVGKNVRSESSNTRRNSSYASLSNVFTNSSTSPGKVSPDPSDSQLPMLSLGGPIKLSIGHTFGPDIGLLSPQSIKLLAEAQGDLAVDVNRLEEVQARRKEIGFVPPTPQDRRAADARSPADRNESHPLEAVGDIRVDVRRIRASYSGRCDSVERAADLSQRLPLELVLLGLQVEGRSSTADSSRLHRDWVGSALDVQGHVFRAGADAIQLSVLPLPASKGGEPHQRPDLPSTLTFEAPSVEVFTTCFGCARKRRVDPGLFACIVDLKSVELGMHVVDLERLQNLLRERKQQHRRGAAPRQEPSVSDLPSSSMHFLPPQVLFAAMLGRCKAELAVPSTVKPSEDNLLAFDCSGASLNVETDLRDVVRRPKRKGKQITPLKNWPEHFTASPEQDFAFTIRTAATIQPFELCVRVATSADPSRPTTDIAPPIIKVELSELGGHAILPGIITTTIDDQTSTLQPSMALGNVNAAVGIILIELWDPGLISRLADCIDTVSSLGRDGPHPPVAHTGLRKPSSTNKPAEDLLSRLPAGLTVYLCLARVDVLVAAADPNPACTKKPLRGLAGRTRIIVQYCQLTKHHALQHPTRTASLRTALHLEEDVIVQGVSHTNDNHDPDGRTALLTACTHETRVRPVFNGRRFRTTGPNVEGEFKAFTDMFPHRPPLPDKTASLVGWDFQDDKQKSDELPWATQVRADPFSLSPAERASSPLRVPSIDIRVILRRNSTKPSKHLLALTVPLLSARLDLSHAWAVLVACEGLKSFRSKQPSDRNPASKSPVAVRSALADHFDVRLDAHLLHVDLELPLGERLFLRARKVAGSLHAEGPALAIDSLLAFVPNIRQPALWDELLTIKTIRLAQQSNDTVSASIKTARLRIPYGFKLSQLILNINITIKSVKHLLALFHAADFDLLVEPKVQGPKHFPNILFRCNSLCFEAQDDPMETRLNLIWRVGMAEQSARLERNEAFEAKVAAIEKAEKRDHGSESTSPHLSQHSSRWKFGGKHTVDVAEARERLKLFNSTNYVRRFRNALDEHARKETTHLRQIQANTKRESRLPIDVMPDERCSPMFRMTFFGVAIDITPPSFPLDKLSTFMHNAGNGLPKDTDFSLLVPLHLSWRMDTARVILRDYPVPLFNLPPMTAADDKSRAAFEFESDIVIGEEMAGSDSFFWIPTAVIPADLGEQGAAPFQLKVAKTIMPVKTYARPTIRVNSSQVTSWGWGSSMQPGVQDMMKVFETLTHPPRDSSPRIGFWDKLRLVFHWSVEWTFKGPVHIHAKGSRNPYNIVDHGAGFVLAWSGSPRISINKPNEARELVQIEADNLYFAIPDFRGLLDHRATGHVDGKGGRNDAQIDKAREDQTSTALYSKICAKFTNGARAGWGFVLERTCTDGDCKEGCSGSNRDRQCRIFDFEPHWQVILRTPEALEEHHIDKEKNDSYHGFRSDYIHFSMSITSPTNRHCPTDESDPAGYNSFHFSPKGFTHFFAWWRLFGGNMSLPIRQGKLFPNSPPPSKKFGKSLATIKYRFEIAPLFISHLYANDSRSDWDKGLGTYLGIKVKLAKFRADLHQREQERTVTNEKLGRTKRIPHKPFYAADIVLDDIDLRAVSVLCREPEKAEVKKVTEGIPDDPVFIAPTELPDPSWRDRDDLVETDRACPDENARIELHQIGVCPRFTFKKRPRSAPLQRRSKDSKKDEAPVLEETSKFGHEPTHLCHLDQSKDPLQLQIDLAQRRLEEVERTLDKLRCGRASKRDAEVEGIPVDDDTPADRSLIKKIVLLQDHINELKKELACSQSRRHKPDELSEHAVWKDTTNPSKPPNDTQSQAAPESWESFDNVIQVHHPHITWTDEARNICLKYYYHSRARRGFEYHMSALAVKFVREMTAHRAAKPASSPSTSQHFHPAAAVPSRSHKKSSRFSTGRSSSSALATGLLNMISGDQPDVASSEPQEAKRTFVHHNNGQPPTPDPWEGLSEGMQIQQNYCFILVKPQIAFRSSVNEDSVVVFAAMSANLKMYGVLDERDLDDPVNSRVMRRSYMTLTAMQAFYPADRDQERADFVPLEILLDVRSQTSDFERIIPQTSASLQHDKFNQLRLRNTSRSTQLACDLASQDTCHLRHNMDLAVVNVPRLAVTSDPKQFAALYNIVTDLLLYQDSVERERNKRLDDFIYSFDHSNLSEAVEIVRQLQHRIRVIDRMQTNLRANTDRRLLEHSVELVALKAEKRQLVDELDLLFLAIAAAQDPRDADDKTNRSSFKFEATSSEISWNMLSADKRLLAKTALKQSKFSVLSQKDSSDIIEIAIMDLQALNGQPDALFPEMLSRYERQSSQRNQPMIQPFLQLKFHVLAPVGGIAIIQYFGLQVHPVRVQMEHKTGKAIMAYFFQEHDAVHGNEGGKAGKKDKKAIADASHDKKSAERNSGESARSDPTAEDALWASAPPKRSSSSQNLSAVGASLRPLTRVSSSTSVTKTEATSGHGTPRVKHSRSSLSLKEQVEKSQAEEMRSRASHNRTFVYIEVESSTFVMSYKGERAKNLTDMHDFRFTTPSFVFHNKTWGFQDLVDELKSQMLKAAWSQKGSLVSQIFTKTGRKATAALGYQQNSGSNTSVASSASSSSTKLAEPTPSWTPSASAPDDLNTFGAGKHQPSTSPTSSRKSDSLLRRTLHLSRSRGSLSERSAVSEGDSPTSSQGPYIVVSPDSDYASSSASSFVSLSEDELSTTQAKRDALLGRSLAPP